MAMVVEVDGHRIEISSPDKVLFPDDGITKADLVEYYRRAGPLLVAHAEHRPLALHRFPDGIGAHGFFQKNASDWFPDWIPTVELEKSDGTTRYVVLDRPATLVYLAGQGVITPHTLMARAEVPHRPVEVIIDLDPSTPDRGPVQAAARRLRELLEDRGHQPRVKSSGSRGLHVHIDVDVPDFDAGHALAEEVCRQLVEEDPDTFTLAFRKADRGDRLLLDIARNRPGQHAVAPYAVRALPGAPVAAPLDWDEALSARWDPQRWTIRNLFRRLGQREDPWSRARPS
jgi:bifunctional non-homologous end joining protein LigD